MAHDPLGGTGIGQALEKNKKIDTYVAHEQREGTLHRGEQDTPPADDTPMIPGGSVQVGISTEGDELTRGDGERAHEEKEEKAKPAVSTKEEDLFYSKDETLEIP